MIVVPSKSNNSKRRGRHKGEVCDDLPVSEAPFDDKVKEEPRKEQLLNRARHRSIISSRLVTNGGFFTFCLLFVVFFLYDEILATRQPLDIEALTKDLESNVEGQQDAINLVLQGVQKMYSLEKKLNIISFFGSTGVGKTYITQIVKNHLSASTYEIQGPLSHFNVNNFIDHIHSNEYRYNLIIADDLTLADVDILLNLLKAIPRDLGVVAICIFNIQETDDRLNYSVNYKRIDDILDKFQEAHLVTEVAKFHQFDEEQANRWVSKQLKGKVNHNVIDSVLLGQDLKCHGFKRLSAKLGLIKF